MSTVDSRIVTMKFDNSAFERAVQVTMGTISKLGAVLAGINPTKDLGGINKAVANTDLSPLDTQVSGISAKFLALGTVAVTALATITSKAVESGLAFAKSFTFGPIIDGLHEYETNLQSIQTIQANTDRPLPEINAALQELNRYSDKTIYNFSEMAKNIGTFTAAGVDLHTSVSSIKGIANMAALSGSNSQQASTAMYQLSQAIASGKVGLQDWNSVVNAGMGGKKLQLALAQTGVAMGDLGANAVKMVGPMKQLKISGMGFRNSITAAPGNTPWLTSDILVNTLSSLDGRFSKLAQQAELTAQGVRKYSDAQIDARITAARLAMEQKNGVKYTDAQFKSLEQLSNSSFLAATQVKTLGQVFDVAKETIGSGWGATFQNIFGDFGESKKTFTELSGVINGFINANSLARNTVLKDWHDMGGRTVLIQGIINVFKALGNVLIPIRNAFRTVFPKKTGKDLLGITKSFRDFTEKLIAGKGTMHDIHRIFKGVFGVLGLGLDIIKGVVHYFASLFGLVTGNTGGFLHLLGALSKVVFKFTQWIKQGDYIKKFFDKVIAGRAAVFGPILKVVSDIARALGNLVHDGLKRFIDGMGGLAPFEAKLSNLGKAFRQVVSEKIVALVAKLKEYFAALSPYINAVGQNLKLAYNSIKKFFGGVDYSGMLDAFTGLVATGADAFVALLVKGLTVLGPILSKVGSSVKGAFTSIQSAIGNVDFSGVFDFGASAIEATKGISSVSDAFGILSPVASGAKTQVVGFGGVLKTVAGVVAGFAVWIGHAIQGVAASFMDGWDQLFVHPGGFITGVGQFVSTIGHGIANAFQKLHFDGVTLSLETLLKAAIGAGTARALWNLGGMFKDMKEVFDGAGQVFGQVTSNLKTMQKDVRANIILKIAGALGILAVSLYILSKIDQAGLARGLGAVIALITTLVLAIKSIEKAMPDKGTLANAVHMAAIGPVLIALASAILIIAAAVFLFGKMKPKVLAQGMASVVGVIGALVLATVALNKSGGGASMLAASAALLLMSFALVAMAGAIKLYSSLDTGMLVEGGAKIVILITALGLAMRAFPVTGAVAAAASMIVMSVAITIIAKAIMTLAKLDAGDSWQSLITLGVALTLLAIAANAMVEAAPGAAAMLIMAAAVFVLTKSLVMLAGVSVLDLIKAITALAAVLVVLGAVAAALLVTGAIAALLLLGAAIVLLGVGLLTAGTGLFLFATAMTLMATVSAASLDIFIALINQFLDAMPQFITKLGASFIAIADVITKSAPAYGRAITAVLGTFLDSVTTLAPKFAKFLGAMIVAGLSVIRTYYDQMIKTGISFIMSFLRGVRDNIPRFAKVATDICVEFMDAVAVYLPKLADRGAKAMIRFMNGMSKAIDDNVDGLRNAGLNMAHSIINGMTGGLLDEGIQKVKDAAGALADTIPSWMKKILGIHSPSKVMHELGGFVGQGLANGLDSGGAGVVRSSQGLGKNVLDTMNSTMRGVSDALASNVDFDPTITPVLDLTKMQQDASKIGGMLNHKPITADVSLNKAASISAATQAARADSGSKDPVKPVKPEPRPVVFNIAHVEDGNALMRRARATNKMLTLAEGGDSLQIERIT